MTVDPHAATIPARSSGVLLLMYHAVLKEDANGQAMDAHDRAYAVSQATFQEHLDLIERLSAGIGSPALLKVRPEGQVDPNHRSGYDHPIEVVLTFDDAWQEHARVTLPILSERGWQGVVFLTTGQIGTPGMLSRDEAALFAEAGWEVGSHGASHRFLNSLSDTELRDELESSRKQLGQYTDQPVEWLSLPGGREDARVGPAARGAGYTRVFGSVPGLWQSDASGTVPRCVVRGGEAGTRALTRLLTAPHTEVTRLEMAASRRRLIRRILGDRAYHWLHGMITGR